MGPHTSNIISLIIILFFILDFLKASSLHSKSGNTECWVLSYSLSLLYHSTSPYPLIVSSSKEFLKIFITFLGLPHSISVKKKKRTFSFFFFHFYFPCHLILIFNLIISIFLFKSSSLILCNLGLLFF